MQETSNSWTGALSPAIIVTVIVPINNLSTHLKFMSIDVSFSICFFELIQKFEQCKAPYFVFYTNTKLFKRATTGFPELLFKKQLILQLRFLTIFEKVLFMQR